MTTHSGPGLPTEPPSPDFTYADALEQARRDFARLAQGHNLWWQIDGDLFYIGCDCDGRRRTPLNIEAHIRTAVRMHRGPIKR